MITTSRAGVRLSGLLRSAVQATGLDALSPADVAGLRVSGLTAGAKALAIAAAAGDRPLVVVVPGDRDIEPLVADVAFFLGALHDVTADDVADDLLPFPSHEVDPYRGLTPHLDVTSARARALHALATGRARVVVASVAALLPRISSTELLLRSSADLRTGAELDPMVLVDRLTEAGYTRQDPVDQHGEFWARGGLIDVFLAFDAQPIRIEFVGDLIESIRRYDPLTQRSVGQLERAVIVPVRDWIAVDGETPDRSSTVRDHLERGGARVLVSEWDDIVVHGQALQEQIWNSYHDAAARGRTAPEPDTLVASWQQTQEWLAGATRLEQLDIQEDAAPTLHVSSQVAPQYHGRIAEWVADVRQALAAGDRMLVVAGTTGRAERIIELLREYDVAAAPPEQDVDEHPDTGSGRSVDADPGTVRVLVVTGPLTEGFRLPRAALQVWAETDIFDEERLKRERRAAAGPPRETVRKRFFSDFRDLKIGDYVVHVDHGIGVFVGLKSLAVGAETQEFMALRYAGEDKLFVPVERLDLVQKYSGGARPTLDRLGGTTWEKAKTRVKKAMRDMAGELLKLYAARKAMPGHAYGTDTHWQEEFENAFEYELTVDQQNAITDIKRDMETPSPMDRLLCGDVGYGKTEVAMRAAFKVVMEGKQVAVLAPTTVLAFQHLRTLQSRFAAFPLRIDMVSRFRSKQEQAATLAELASGRLDIIVGTHRLLSKDVQFHDLGLLVVDEEQRFGVAHKERIKQLRRKVDVLTMSATPIPRTLNMSLVGIRDMSVIETPPRDRLAIQTSVVKFDQQVIASAIRHEIERQGQVYFVHNRVESIYSLANLLQRLVPEARIGVGHGQMGDDALEKVMIDFVARRYDVLVATTIIENGLDIPNANTMIINRADRYGLAQLYQLRGRVGRSDRRAYAYLLVPPGDLLSPVARKRLSAIREFSDLGSGFRVAALDLEIRGAGNLLGGEQSGHIEAIGFEMYLKLMEETIRELRGEDLVDDGRAAVNLKVDLRIEESYIADVNQRLTVYRRIASARTEDELAEAMAEVRDRYGPPPESVLNLAIYATIRVLADRLRVEALDREGSAVVFKFRTDGQLDPARVVHLVHNRPDLRLLPPSALRLDLKQPVVPPALGRDDAKGGRDVRSAPPGGRAVASGVAGGRSPAQGSRLGRKPETGGESWWTKRAKAGEVTPGFDRQTLTRQAPEDPRAENGLFDRVIGVLRELTRVA